MLDNSVICYIYYCMMVQPNVFRVALCCVFFICLGRKLLFFFIPHLFALLEAPVGFMNSSCNLLVFQLTQLALRVSQPGHHASG